MTDENNLSANQIDFMQKMKAITSDFWGIVQDDAPAETGTQENPAEDSGAQAIRNGIKTLWKTADETIDWTDALAHTTPTDGLTGSKMWNFYRRHAEKVLSGDLDAYTEVLKTANPLGELTEYAESINMRAPSADRLESTFECKPELMGKDSKLYLSAMGLRIARDLLACLPVNEVAVTGEHEGKPVFQAVYRRQDLLHRNFSFIDPVAFSKECDAVFS